jgi:hypothetical protein
MRVSILFIQAKVDSFLLKVTFARSRHIVLFIFVVVTKVILLFGSGSSITDLSYVEILVAIYIEPDSLYC